ncbi:hypothetical protein [Mucilaginibacter segetis]|nr:hypothetical protein [Mucilaginibacter segetis]
MAKLQGKWKETEYPFRWVEFKDSTVKFTEEGVAKKPEFEKFKLSAKCPFDVNNIKELKPGDVFIVMDRNQTCQKIDVSDDTLTFSGFSTNTNKDYAIVYKKVSQ